MTSEITFAIPFYKGKAFLREAMASVFAQSSTHWRILVCDEGAEPGGIDDVLAEFDSSRIRHVRNPQRLGIVGNWNACLDNAETDLVTLLHADDKLAPDYLSLIQKGFSQHPDAAAVFCDASIIGPQSQPVFSFPDWVKMRFYTPRLAGRIARVSGGPAVSDLLTGCYIFCPTLCYSKARIRERRFDGKWFQVQDLAFMTQLLAEGETLVRVAEIGYQYRRHADNLTASMTANLRRFEEEVALYDAVGGLARDKGWSQAVQTARQKNVIKLNLSFCILRELAGGQWRTATVKIRFLFGLVFSDYQ